MLPSGGDATFQGGINSHCLQGLVGIRVRLRQGCLIPRGISGGALVAADMARIGTERDACGESGAFDQMLRQQVVEFFITQLRPSHHSGNNPSEFWERNPQATGQEIKGGGLHNSTSTSLTNCVVSLTGISRILNLEADELG